MDGLTISPTLILAAVVVLYIISSIQILAEYERGVIFRLGKLLPHPKGPGVVLVFRPIDRIVRISLRTVVHDVPPQDIITRQRVVKVNAVVFFRVIDPRKAVVEVENYVYATSQLAQTTLRSVLGQAELDDLLAQRDRLNQELQQILDHLTDPWGVKVSAVEVKHVDLPENMQRAMGRQAEAEREKRAKIIHAEGELIASDKLAQAAAIIDREPSAITLRYLQTLTEIEWRRTRPGVPAALDLLCMISARRRAGRMTGSCRSTNPHSRSPAGLPPILASGESWTMSVTGMTQWAWTSMTLIGRPPMVTRRRDCAAGPATLRPDSRAPAAPAVALLRKPLRVCIFSTLGGPSFREDRHSDRDRV